MTEGLININYAVLKQLVDPLEYCAISCPCPSKIGIPCWPCELPNEFSLF